MLFSLFFREGHLTKAYAKGPVDLRFRCVRCERLVPDLVTFYWLKSRKREAQYVHATPACFNPFEDVVLFEILNDPSSDYVWVRNPRTGDVR